MALVDVQKESGSGRSDGLCHRVWCLGGDFNVVRWLSKRNKAFWITKSMRKFNHFVSSYDHLDPPMVDGLFTWSRLGDRPVGFKID